MWNIPINKFSIEDYTLFPRFAVFVSAFANTETSMQLRPQTMMIFPWMRFDHWIADSFENDPKSVFFYGLRGRTSSKLSRWCRINP